MKHESIPFSLPLPGADAAARLRAGGAVIWSEPVSIPTYEPAEADRFPQFLERRVYQGSSGRVYPIPFVDKIATEPTDRLWEAVHLENRWIRVMVLPELGGRIHVAYDKTVGYDFFYRNNVIKPALVGLAGPWVSGGVEFNWPQHHRPATFLPVDWHIEHGDDGSVTVWCSDHDPFARMKGMHGIRLHPDHARIEALVRLHNRTDLTQTFLWWANAAARVHDDYQCFFPTDVRFVADHARRAITAFPQADRPYYGVDYPALGEGRDGIDWYRNIPVPTSYMVTDTADNFFGGYDHAAGAGFVHVADRTIAPGKKLWTWGDAAFGHAWDRLLTDDDGPYVELMAGVYTDNQPDFAWLMPGETKTFRQTWFPIQRIGVAHQANRDAAVHLSLDGSVARIGVAVTSLRSDAVVTLSAADGSVVWSWEGTLIPGKPLIASAAGAPALDELTLEVCDAMGILLSWSPRPASAGKPAPEVATVPPLPTEVDSVDELYFTGIHLAQYRHPTRSPVPYWIEGLSRDPGDVRCHLALADHHLRAADYQLALTHVTMALQRVTARNKSPFSGEAWYLHAVVLERQGRTGDAYESYARAFWDAKWAAPASLGMARIDARSHRDAQALDRLVDSFGVPRVVGDSRATALHVILLRRLDRVEDADAVLCDALRIDPLDHLARTLTGQPNTVNPRILIDTALDLASFGESDTAIQLLVEAGRAPATSAGTFGPIAHLHRARILDLVGRTPDATAARESARTVDRTRAFPSGLDDFDALSAAILAEPLDGVVRALLGTLLYDCGRCDEALEQWTAAIERGIHDPVTLRNTAMARYNVQADVEGASALYRDALISTPRDARLQYEYDQLLARSGATPTERLSRLETEQAVPSDRDDLTVTWCKLLIAVGRPEEATAALESRTFQPWEGGEGESLDAWETAWIAIADRELHAGRGSGALDAIDRALHPPCTLGEARHPLASTATLHTLRALALDLLGRPSEAEVERAAAEASPRGVRESEDNADYFATSLPELLLFRH